MADDGNQVGVSVKLPDGTMVWSKRPEWALVLKDIETIFGPDSFVALTEMLVEGIRKPGATVQSNVVPLPRPEDAPPAANSEPGVAGEFKLCAEHGVPKDRWVAPGVSKTTGRRYSGFYACPVPGCRSK